MYPPVVTKDPTAVQVEVQAAYLGMFASGDPLFVPRVFGWVSECFGGGYQDYQAIDARYHDFEHTLQGTLCLGRLLHGRHLAGVQPVLTPSMFQLGLLAILLHDSGYLKKRDDAEGTGAKYTITHVARSVEFAAQLLREKGFSGWEVSGVQNMIRCTGINARISEIAFQSELEKIVGLALATADLLGQLAAVDYVDKLPILYEEFAEAVRFSRDQSHFLASFTSANDLMRKTPEFWSRYVRARLDGEFGGVYRFLNQPYPDGPNPYCERIESNIERIRRCVEAEDLGVVAC